MIEALKSRGLWPGAWNRQLNHSAGSRACRDRSEKDQVTRATAALAIWQKSGPAAGTIVQTYMRSRGLLLPLPPTIRFHPRPEASVWQLVAGDDCDGDNGARATRRSPSIAPTSRRTAGQKLRCGNRRR